MTGRYRSQDDEAVKVPATLSARLHRTSTPVQRARRWWRERLAGIGPAQALPDLLSVPKAQTGGRRTVAISLPDPVANHLATWSHGSPVRLLAGLAVAMSMLSARYAARSNAVVSTPIPGTNAVDRLLPISLFNVEDEPPRRLLEQALDRLAAIPSVIKDMGDIGSEPWFEEVLGRNEAVVTSVCVEPLQRRPHHPDVVCVGRLQGSTVEIELDLAGGIDSAFEQRLEQHLRRLLEYLMQCADRPMDEWELLAADERATIMHHSHGPAQAQLPETLPTRVVRLAEEVPNHVALVFRDRRMTYRDLIHAARATAQRLVERGVKQDDRVALLLERGDLPVVAALGVFLRGAAYVPVDTTQPDSRIRFILADADVTAVITERHLRDRVPDPLADRVVELEDPRLLAEASGPSCDGPNRQMPAYAIYTSGTAGEPKAVLVDHGAFAATCAAYGAAYGLTAIHPVALQIGSIAFDVFNGDLGRSLYYGGTLVVCGDDERTEPDRLADVIAREGVTILESTPALVNPLAEVLARRPDATRSLDVVIASADAWRSHDYRRVRKLLGPDVRVFNTYGVTEAAVDSTCYPPGDGYVDTPYVPIGLPLRGVSAYVLSRGSHLLPQGVIGELCLGGGGLADSYLNRPSLTAERFTPDPFVAGARLYRTGDLVRRLPEGNLEFLGRADHQVKIRGYRVELGEVEATIRRHPNVEDVVVTASPDEYGDSRLIAYIATTARVPTTTQLRQYCGLTLPVYMIPVLFITLPRIPLNENGKVDRSALPSPTVQRPVVDTEYCPPCNPTEELISHVWRETLDLSSVGIHDDFFDLGGHSLLATRIVAQLERALGRTVRVRALFQYPTIAELASYLSNRHETKSPDN